MSTSQIYNPSFINSPAAGDDIIRYILQAVEARVNELKEKVKLSTDVLPLGIHTDLTTQIKQVVEDPLTHLLTTKKNLNSTIASLITTVVKEYFLLHKDKIYKAFITDAPTNNDLHFSIVLNDDNEDDRSLIFSLLRDYKHTNLWESYPIYFQIVPQEICNKINGKEIFSH